MKCLISIVVLAVSSVGATAQVANPAQPMPSRSPSVAPVAAPSQMRPVGAELNFLLSQLEQTTQQTASDVTRLTIKKWKTDSQYKEQSQHDADSIQSNVTGTLPALVSQVRNSPDNLASLFKLYRNVDALWDVLRSLTESAGAFGQKGEYQTLENDARNLASVRSSLANQLDTIASAQQSEISRLRTLVAQASAAPPPPPKKIVVDDNEPPKKPVRKKKAASAAAKPKTDAQAAQPPKQ
jgi:hypothetical protein